MKRNRGKLYGVGVGPGDPELMSLKAVRIIKESDLIALPAREGEECTAWNIARGAVPEMTEKPVVYIPMPMTKDKEKLEQAHAEGTARIAELLGEGKEIAFLTLGDPTVYSTYIYIHKRIREAGFETEIISGIPSFCAAAARMDMSLVENSEQLHIIPASYQIEEALGLAGTKVLMKAGRNMKAVKEQIRQAGLQAVMVENCGMDGEAVYGSVDEIREDAGYFSLVIAKKI